MLQRSDEIERENCRKTVITLNMHGKKINFNLCKNNSKKQNKYKPHLLMKTTSLSLYPFSPKIAQCMRMANRKSKH